KIGGGGEEETY
ncbi:Type I restriction modification DNA specificity domain protein, partial [Haemophilus influenzae]